METNNIVGHVESHTQDFLNPKSTELEFGLKLENNRKLIPLTPDFSKKPVLYILKDVLEDKNGKQMKDICKRDEFAYYNSSQLALAHKFLDNLAYRRQNSKFAENDNYQILLAGIELFTYNIVRYSQFNTFIDFNELNRLSLTQPIEKGLRELYPLLVTSIGLIDWAMVAQSKKYGHLAQEFKEQALDCLHIKNPPATNTKLMQSAYYHYIYYRDTVLEGQKFTPWLKKSYDDLDITKLKTELADRRNATYQEPQQSR